MRVIIDSAIPYISGVLEPYAEVIYKKGVDINPLDVADCDAMIIRTRTKCNEELLKDSRVKFIGTATIGFDHIDLDYCRRNNIKVETAAGCNAIAVAQYILTAISELEKAGQQIKRVGIIGVGNVGKAVKHQLEIRGYELLLNDPPRAAKEKDFQNSELDRILSECDLITLHVPLDETTRGYFAKDFFGRMKPSQLFINASRGEVVDEKELLDAIDNCRIIYPVIDVWNNEPNISEELLNKAFISTPHIAGYSEQGKANGTAMMVRALASYYSISELRDWYPENISQNLGKIVEISHYDILKDTKSLKSNRNNFEELRNSYNYRKEFL